MQGQSVINIVKDAVIKAGSSFRDDQLEKYQQAIKKEKDPKARWLLENLLENAVVAGRNKGPLCDDTGIPHILLEVGKNRQFSGEFIEWIHEGIAVGLRELPGRPMAIKGDEIQRLDQSKGLNEDPGALLAAPLVIRSVAGDMIRLHVLLLGGGPEIRGKTYRVYHQHQVSVVVDEIVNWAAEGAAQLGCTPSVLAVGIGRTHFEAAALMLEAMVFGDLGIQSDLERQITERLNGSNVGVLGLGGGPTVLGTFLKVGPQRASGVRIVSLRPCCYLEPRVASVCL